MKKFNSTLSTDLFKNLKSDVLNGQAVLDIVYNEETKKSSNIGCCWSWLLICYL